MQEEADSRGVGGHRVGPSEHEAAVRGGDGVGTHLRWIAALELQLLQSNQDSEHHVIVSAAPIASAAGRGEEISTSAGETHYVASLRFPRASGQASE
jgi:hypothetical protein